MPLPRNQQIERLLLSDQAYAVLRSAIIDGTLAPGERLRDAELVLRVGLSRTPIREALARPPEGGPGGARPRRPRRGAARGGFAVSVRDPTRARRGAPRARRDARDAYPIVAALHALAAELGV